MKRHLLLIFAAPDATICNLNPKSKMADTANAAIISYTVGSCSN